MYESEILDVYRKCNVRGFPINCKDIVKGLGFDLISYEDLAESHDDYKRLCMCSNDAFTHYGDRMVIFYNPKSNRGRIRFSIMHEIGHYVLQTESEDEADSFAANILAPPAIILDKNLKSADEISRYFDLSVSAANSAVIGLKKYNITAGSDLVSYFRAFSRETNLISSVPFIQVKTAHKKRTRRRKLFEERESWMLKNVPSFQSLAFISRERDAFFPFG